MNTEYIHAVISAENKEQADAILDGLLAKKLVSGGLISHGPSRFWWDGKITEMEYYNISVFALAEHKSAVIEEVERISGESVPIVAIHPLDGNQKFLDWIRASTS
jgi:uncharacterized protein involved in tolerance to divalent cations